MRGRQRVAQRSRAARRGASLRYRHASTVSHVSLRSSAAIRVLVDDARARDSVPGVQRPDVERADRIGCAEVRRCCPAVTSPRRTRSRRGRSPTQSNTMSANATGGIVGPVENTTVAPVFIDVAAQVGEPGQQRDVYAVFGAEPVARPDVDPAAMPATRGVAVATARSRNMLRRASCAPVPRSLTTSSKSNDRARLATFTAFVSGVTRTSCGGAWSSGPPGGAPADAHAGERRDERRSAAAQRSHLARRSCSRRVVHSSLLRALGRPRRAAGARATNSRSPAAPRAP